MARLTILDVGHGNSAILEDTNGVVIIDAGPRNGLLEFLLQEEIPKINVVLLSHADQDHIGGLINLLASQKFEIDIVRVNTDSSKATDIWEDLVYELSLQQESGRINFKPSLTTADSGEFDQGNVHIQILGPSTYLAAKGPGSTDTAGREITTNAISAVVRLLVSGTPIVLFAGDIDTIGLDDLLNRHTDILAPTLIFPHHGGLAGTVESTVLLARTLSLNTSPTHVIFSIGRNHKTPRPEIIMAIRETVPNVRISCTQLSKHCASILPAILPSYAESYFAKGAESRNCCAGTIVIDTDAEYLHPKSEDHQQFVAAYAPTALCKQEISVSGRDSTQIQE